MLSRKRKSKSKTYINDVDMLLAGLKKLMEEEHLKRMTSLTVARSLLKESLKKPAKK